MSRRIAKPKVIDAPLFIYAELMDFFNASVLKCKCHNEIRPKSVVVLIYCLNRFEICQLTLYENEWYIDNCVFKESIDDAVNLYNKKDISIEGWYRYGR
jgi:hypothetical protein